MMVVVVVVMLRVNILTQCSALQRKGEVAAQIIAADACFTTSRLVWLCRPPCEQLQNLWIKWPSTSVRSHQECNIFKRDLMRVRDAEETRICHAPLPTGGRGQVLQPTTSRAANGAERLLRSWKLCQRAKGSFCCAVMRPLFHSGLGMLLLILRPWLRLYGPVHFFRFSTAGVPHRLGCFGEANCMMARCTLARHSASLVND